MSRYIRLKFFTYGPRAGLWNWVRRAPVGRETVDALTNLERWLHIATT